MPTCRGEVQRTKTDTDLDTDVGEEDEQAGMSAPRWGHIRTFSAIPIAFLSKNLYNHPCREESVQCVVLPNSSGDSR